MEVKEFFKRFGDYCKQIPRLDDKGNPKCLKCKFRDFCYSPPDQLKSNVKDLDDVFNYFLNE